jgi:hypothetical protein
MSRRFWREKALFAPWRYREDITERRVAVWRLGVQIALAVVVASLLAFFPNAFPQPNGCFPFMQWAAIFGIPVALAALYLRGASRHPLP